MKRFGKAFVYKVIIKKKYSTQIVRLPEKDIGQFDPENCSIPAGSTNSYSNSAWTES